MSEKPLLLLPKPVDVTKGRRRGGQGTLHTPTLARQAARVGPQFQALQAAFRERSVMLADSPGSAPAELLLVIETVGPVQDFFRAVSKIPGLRWQLEWDDEIEPDADFYDERDADKQLAGYAFLLLGNQQAAREIQSLWHRWTNRQPLPTGYAPWQTTFKLLRTIRPWNDADRIRGTGIEEYARENLAFARDSVPCEAELCFRETALERQAASARVRRHIEGLGGTVVSEFPHDGIRYHGVLFQIPSSALKAVAELRADIALLRADDVFLLRPAGQSLSRPSQVQTEGAKDDGQPANLPTAALPTRPSIAALLDGLPVQNHVLLRDRIVVVNPESDYSAVRREHGTQMASVILHGDLSASSGQLDRPLVVRPILVADPHSSDGESMPQNRLVIDVVHQAVRDLLAGENPSAPNVRIINFSIADRFTQFDHAMSSWARMLDWLSHEHNLLFIVSGGNHADGSVVTDIRRTDWPSLTETQRQDAVLRAVAASVREQRLRPPAEAANALTIGAVAQDESTPSYLGAGFLPYQSDALPAHYSAFGLGHRRMVKPELFVPGGRLPLCEKLATNGTNGVFDNMLAYKQAAGIRVATPGRTGRLDETLCDRGTSHATALTTRAAIRLWDVLEGLEQSGQEPISQEHYPVLLKAALVHGASWREARPDLYRALGQGLNEAKFRLRIQQLLGFGTPDFARCADCTERRATMLGWGSLSVDKAHEFRIPLPPSLSGVAGLRRLTVTLAYLSPINPRSQKHLSANLWFTVGLKASGQGTLLNVKRSECNDKAVVRGTVQHEVFEGEQRTVFSDDDSLAIQVNASEQAAGFSQPVRYGLAISLEVAEGVGVSVYEEVAARVRALVGIRT